MQTPLVENRSGQRRVRLSEEDPVPLSSQEHLARKMAAILDSPDIRARVLLLSVETYEALAAMGEVDRNAELVRGVIVKKMPKSPLHRKLTRRIFLFLLALQRSGFAVFTEAPLRLADSEPEPDVMIVHGNVSDFDARHPTTAALAIEIAVNSEGLDREKASLYAEAGVAEYWIVLAEENQVEVYRQPENGVYRSKQLYPASETVTCESVPGLRVPLAEWLA